MHPRGHHSAGLQARWEQQPTAVMGQVWMCALRGRLRGGPADPSGLMFLCESPGCGAAENSPLLLLFDPCWGCPAQGARPEGAGERLGGLVSTRMVVLVLGARLRSCPLWQGVLGKAAHCTNIGFLAG